MLELVIRPRAQADFRTIWRYSFQQWGVAQADRYLQDLDREIQDLLQFPELGASDEHIRTGYRALHVKRHLVFYRRAGQYLEIVRVLHEAMDVGSHL